MTSSRSPRVMTNVSAKVILSIVLYWKEIPTNEMHFSVMKILVDLISEYDCA